MKIKLIHSVVAAILFFAVSTFAGDFATLSFIGFSKDGHYLAFEEYGTQDGSGFPYSNIYFIDTTKNAFATPRVAVMIEKEMASESTARSRSAALAAKKLAQFKIVRGNTGRLVISHPLTDQAFDSDGTDDTKANLVKFYEEVVSMHREGDYELLLTPVKVTPKECEGFGWDNFMMELKLTARSNNDAVTILQKDSALPKSRGCVLGYRIQDVYLYKNLIAVLISYDTPGFEGPDLRFLAVAGKFKE